MQTTARLIFAASVLATMTTACSKQGTLTLNNETSGEISGEIQEKGGYTLDADESVEKAWTLKSSIFSSEEKSIAVTGEGDFNFYYVESATVKPGEDAKVDIHADAGRLGLYNNYEYSIVELYVVLSSSSSWGSDTLGSSWPAGAYGELKILPGSYDMLAVCSDSMVFEWYDISVGIEEIEALIMVNENASPARVPAGPGSPRPARQAPDVFGIRAATYSLPGETAVRNSWDLRTPRRAPRR